MVPRHFIDDILWYIFFNKNAWMLIQISQTLVLIDLIHNKLSLANVMDLPNRRKAIARTNDGLVYWCIYSSLGFNYLFYHDVGEFLTSDNQKNRIWSCDESGLCNPRPRLVGDEVVVGPSLMFRKMDPWNVIRNILQDKTKKINCKEKWYTPVKK